jgi:hypothetical protein
MTSALQIPEAKCHEPIVPRPESLELCNGAAQRGRPLRRLYFANLVPAVSQNGRRGVFATWRPVAIAGGLPLEGNQGLAGRGARYALFENPRQAVAP